MPGDLGPCCNCGTTEGVNCIVMLDRRGPVPGTGWGCVVCGLPCDGAVAVLCEACVGNMPPKTVCSGYAENGVRVSYDSLSPDKFDHDASKHNELEG